MSDKYNILLTGSRGFIGTYLCEALKNVKDVKIFEIEKSLLDPSVFDSIPENINIQHVYHLAAKTYVPDSWENPTLFYETNLLGTSRVLEFCRLKKSRLTFLSSYVYGLPQYLPINEEHPLSPISPYNHSKILAEELCRFFSQTWNIPITIYRPFNIYGPKQDNNFLIPSIISQIKDPLSQKILLKDLKPKRDYLYISDLVDALLCSLNEKEQFSIYNLGSGNSLSVLEVVNTILEESKSSKKVESIENYRINEINDCCANILKIKEHSGWIPKVSFREGIRRVLISESLI